MRQVWAKALTLTLILNFSLLFPIEVQAARYVDMTGNWAEKYVNLLSDKGIIPAAEDGRFRPGDPVTRAVLSVWLVNALGLQGEPVPSTSDFADVKPDAWYFKAVEIVKHKNYIEGYADGFRPNQYIQRGEVITILARTLNVPNPDKETLAKELAKYTDGVKVPDWARAGVAKLSLSGVLLNYPNKKVINAATIATRADTAALICSLDNYLAQKSIAEATANMESGLPATTNGQAQTDKLSAERPQMASPSSNSVNAPYIPYSSSAPLGQPAMAQGYNRQYASGNYAPSYQQQYPSAQSGYGNYAPSGQYGGYPQQTAYLQGRVAIVSAGTEFHASIINTLDSGSSQPGEQVTATLNEPLYANGQVVVPAGSKIIGQVTNVVSARHFRFGSNGRIDVHFTSLETPDGRRFPLSASIDQNQLRLVGGTTRGRVGKSLLATGVGAGGGAALGTGLGAITGGLSGSRSMGMSTGMGAVFGTAMGSIVGLGAAAYRKGGEVKIIAGQALPIRLDESLQIAGGAPPPPAYGGGSYNGGYGGGYSQPPVQQPAGQYYNQ